MPAMCELHPHYFSLLRRSVLRRRATRWHEREIDREVRWRTGKRLDVYRPLAFLQSEKRTCPRLTGAFNLIGDFIPPIVAFSRIPFCVFIDTHRTERFAHIVRNNIFRCNQIDHPLLTGFFFLQEVFYLFIAHKSPLFIALWLILDK